MGNHKRILVVDDEKSSRILVSKNLSKFNANYEVDVASSGKEALDKIASKSYDLVITDLMMPDLDGLELIRRTRTTSPNTRLILITAYGDESIQEQARLLDVSRYINKPVWLKELLGAAEEALAKGAKGGSRGAEKERKKILIIEDSRTQAEHLQRILEQEDLDVQIAPDGQTGINMVHQMKPDLIVLDLELPGMNGLQLCQALDSEEDTTNIPIIMLTSHDSPDRIRAALQAGVADYIPKDAFADAVLLETIRQMGLTGN